MFNNLMKILILAMCTILISTSIYAESCRLSDVRISYVYDGKDQAGNSVAYIGFKNFETAAGVYFDKDKMNSENQELFNFLMDQSKSKKNFFDIKFSGYACAMIKINKTKNTQYFFAPEVEGFARSSGEINPNCDRSYNATPTMFMLPTMEEFDDILSHVAGFNKSQVKEFQDGMLEMFLNMNPQRPQANTIALPVILFEKLSLLGLKKISNDQMKYLISTFEDDLSTDELNLLDDIISQIRNINFSKDKKGNTVVRIETFRGDIQLNAQDIPTENKEQKKILEETLHHLKINNGAKIVYHETDKNVGLKKEIEVRGIDVVGDFPVIGRVKISPREASIDLTNDDVPAEVKVKFKKGISLYWTFDIKQ